MTDVFSKAKRSEIMSKIRSTGTKPEKILEKSLKKRKFKFKKHGKLPGRPDFVFEKAKLAVFVDGKFWHGYRFSAWRNKLAPFWLEKITENRRRDRKAERQLKKLGWRILRFWDFEVNKNAEKCLNTIERELK